MKKLKYSNNFDRLNGTLVKRRWVPSKAPSYRTWYLLDDDGDKLLGKMWITNRQWRGARSPDGQTFDRPYYGPDVLEVVAEYVAGVTR